MFLPHPRVKVSIVGSLRDREVACSASDRQGSNFEYCVWRTVSSHLSHHPQEVLLAQFSLYMYKGGLKPDSFHFHLHQQDLQVYREGRDVLLAFSKDVRAALRQAYEREFDDEAWTLSQAAKIVRRIKHSSTDK